MMNKKLLDKLETLYEKSSKLGFLLGGTNEYRSTYDHLQVVCQHLFDAVEDEKAKRAK